MVALRPNHAQLSSRIGFFGQLQLGAGANNSPRLAQSFRFPESLARLVFYPSSCPLVETLPPHPSVDRF
jgi:hypothetical protein